LFVGSIRRKFMDLLDVFPQNVVKINDRRVGRAAMYAFFRAFVVYPHLAVTLFVASGRLHVFLAVALIPAICVSALIFGVFIRH
jgi:fatty acid desaturase